MIKFIRIFLKIEINLVKSYGGHFGGGLQKLNKEKIK